MIEVTITDNDANTRSVFYSGISAEQAIVCAYMQTIKKDFNTWDYPTFEDLFAVVKRRLYSETLGERFVIDSGSLVFWTRSNQ